MTSSYLDCAFLSRHSRLNLTGLQEEGKGLSICCPILLRQYRILQYLSLLLVVHDSKLYQLISEHPQWEFTAYGLYYQVTV